MKKLSKAAQVREAVEQGLAPAVIAKKLKVPLSTVYTTRWKMKTAKKGKKVPLAIDETKVKVNSMLLKKISINNPYLDDVMEIRRQIDDLLVIENYLRTRADQVTQNEHR
jgi:hypothetical protein